jgi:hypothetical protein
MSTGSIQHRREIPLDWFNRFIPHVLLIDREKQGSPALMDSISKHRVDRNNVCHLI